MFKLVQLYDFCGVECDGGSSWPLMGDRRGRRCDEGIFEQATARRTNTAVVWNWQFAICGGVDVAVLFAGGDDGGAPLF
jgi:hypothetical protein